MLKSKLEAEAYWQRRHLEMDDLRSGGDIGRTVHQNEAFYQIRVGALVEIISVLADDDAPLQVLDAGCGRGIISDALSRQGFEVTAFDPSGEAIDRAQATRPGPTYVEASFDTFVSDRFFDVVCSIDVLFHLTDDESFRAALARLAGLVRLGGRLVVTERDLQERQELGDYIVHRPLEEYRTICERAGLQLSGFRPYRFPGNPIGFAVFDRGGIT